MKIKKLVMKAQRELLSTISSNRKKKNKTKKSEDDIASRIHPILIASARLQANGTSELSKSINLAELVSKEEYFILSNIIRSSSTSAANSTGMVVSGDTKSNNGGEVGSGVGQTSATASVASVASGADRKGLIVVASQQEEDAKAESNLRTRYVLKRKQEQFKSAAFFLKRFHKRCRVVTTAQKVLDRRLLELRKRWRLAAPEHGKVEGPVRPQETVAIDIEIYDRDRSSMVGSDGLGRIARIVPRYATIELSDDYDIKEDLKRQQKSCKRNKVLEEDDSKNACEEKKGSDKKLLEEEVYTKAEPFVVADPTLGAIDENFDPQKVPMLTLLFQIEKSSTGFVQTISLSSTANHRNDTTLCVEASSVNRKNKADEQVIQSLQHSRFCFKLFDSIRREIAIGQDSTNQSIRQNNPIVWLSSEMEESFLPPPSHMVGNGKQVSHGDENFQPSPICVVHCHEGEVKVQLDSEYTLTVKLVDAKHSLDTLSTGTGIVSKKDFIDPGSQSPEQLHALCRMLLLHAQFVYHDYCTKSQEEEAMYDELIKESDEGKSMKQKVESRNRRKALPSIQKEMKLPHILQSCVNLGAKTLFECKVRRSLKRFGKWLESNHSSLVFDVEWLPLSSFNSHSQLAISIGGTFCVDVSIDGYEMRVTSFGDDGDYRFVNFSSSKEFEVYLKMEAMRRLLKE